MAPRTATRSGRSTVGRQDAPRAHAHDFHGGGRRNGRGEDPPEPGRRVLRGREHRLRMREKFAIGLAPLLRRPIVVGLDIVVVMQSTQTSIGGAPQ